MLDDLLAHRLRNDQFSFGRGQSHCELIYLSSRRVSLTGNQYFLLEEPMCRSG